MFIKKFNITITGFNVNHSEELKNLLRKLIPQNYMINWITTSDQNINCLLIYNKFYEATVIQHIDSSESIENHTPFYLSLRNSLLFE